MVNRCGDCDFLNYSDCKWGGEKVWCNKKGYYVRPTDPACNSYTYNSHNYGSSSSCYLTTAMVDILGFEDNCEYLEILREFRNDYMKSNEEYFDLLQQYDIVGPMICESLYNDPKRKDIASWMLENYIKKAVNFVKCSKFREAIAIYLEMTNNLLLIYKNHYTNVRK